MATITVTPAYGRDYKTAKEVEADWEAGKDFRISDMSHPNDGSYVNKQDAPKGGTIKIRFARLTKIASIEC